MSKGKTVHRLVREKVFQAMYLLENREELTIEEAIEQAIYYDVWDQDLSLSEALEPQLPTDVQENQDREAIAQETLAKIKQMLTGIYEHLAEIDQLIAKNLDKWTIERLEKTNLYILRIGVYELYHRTKVDERIIMNEAIEITKTFNDDKASKFVNGVLQGVLDHKLN